MDLYRLRRLGRASVACALLVALGCSVPGAGRETRRTAGKSKNSRAPSVFFAAPHLFNPGIRPEFDAFIRAFEETASQRFVVSYASPESAPNLYETTNFAAHVARDDLDASYAAVLATATKAVGPLFKQAVAGLHAEEPRSAVIVVHDFLAGAVLRLAGSLEPAPKGFGKWSADSPPSCGRSHAELLLVLVDPRVGEAVALPERGMTKCVRTCVIESMGSDVDPGGADAIHEMVALRPDYFRPAPGFQGRYVASDGGLAATLTSRKAFPVIARFVRRMSHAFLVTTQPSLTYEPDAFLPEAAEYALRLKPSYASPGVRLIAFDGRETEAVPEIYVSGDEIKMGRIAHGHTLQQTGEALFKTAPPDTPPEGFKALAQALERRRSLYLGGSVNSIAEAAYLADAKAYVEELPLLEMPFAYRAPIPNPDIKRVKRGDVRYLRYRDVAFLLAFLAGPGGGTYSPGQLYAMQPEGKRASSLQALRVTREGDATSLSLSKHAWDDRFTIREPETQGSLGVLWRIAARLYAALWWSKSEGRQDLHDGLMALREAVLSPLLGKTELAYPVFMRARRQLDDGLSDLMPSVTQAWVADDDAFVNEPRAFFLYYMPDAFFEPWARHHGTAFDPQQRGVVHAVFQM